jgi:hypothetical protein
VRRVGLKTSVDLVHETLHCSAVLVQRRQKSEKVLHFLLIQQVHFTLSSCSGSSSSSASASASSPSWFLLRAWLVVETRAGLLVLMLRIHRVAAWHTQLPTYLPTWVSVISFFLPHPLSLSSSHYICISSHFVSILLNRFALHRISHRRLSHRR